MIVSPGEPSLMRTPASPGHPPISSDVCDPSEIQNPWSLPHWRRDSRLNNCTRCSAYCLNSDYYLWCLKLSGSIKSWGELLGSLMSAGLAREGFWIGCGPWSSVALLFKKSRVRLHRGLSPNVGNLCLRVSGMIRAEVKFTKSTVMSKELLMWDMTSLLEHFWTQWLSGSGLLAYSHTGLSLRSFGSVGWCWLFSCR